MSLHSIGHHFPVGFASAGGEVMCISVNLWLILLMYVRVRGLWVEEEKINIFL
jgi:hypothetical protein